MNRSIRAGPAAFGRGMHGGGLKNRNGSRLEWEPSLPAGAIVAAARDDPGR
jgi:hypothetical protein